MKLYEQESITSVVSAPVRGPWGNPRFRGNCDGTLIKNLILRYQAKHIADPMEGSGTTGDVVAGLNAAGHEINYWGGDLRTGSDPIITGRF